MLDLQMTRRVLYLYKQWKDSFPRYMHVLLEVSAVLYCESHHRHMYT